MHPRILHYSDSPEQPSAAWEAALYPLLAPEKAAAIRRLRDAADRGASLTGLLLLVSAGREAGVRVDLRTVVHPARGKPSLPAGGDFSISHTRGRVACVFAGDGRVGLDIERAGSVGPRALRRVTHAAEARGIAAGLLDPTALAVQKEAVAKADGGGVAILASIAIDGDRAKAREITYRLHRLEIGAPYIAFLADSVECAPPVPRYVAPAELLLSAGVTARMTHGRGKDG